MTGDRGARPLLQPARPSTEIEVDLLLDVVASSLGPSGAGPHLEVRLEDRDGPHPLIVLEEDDRLTAVPALDLAAKMSRAGVHPEGAAVALAFDEWLDARPSTDREALDTGLTTLAWSGRGPVLRWRVVVPRRAVQYVEWVPSLRTPRPVASAIRRAAASRAGQLAVTPVPVGEVVVWTHPAAPSLSTAVLVRPGALVERHPADESFAVVAPDRPVAVAGRVAAERLSEESAEAHVVVPLCEVVAGRWPTG